MLFFFYWPYHGPENRRQITVADFHSPTNSRLMNDLKSLFLCFVKILFSSCSYFINIKWHSTNGENPEVVAQVLWPKALNPTISLQLHFLVKRAPLLGAT